MSVAGITAENADNHPGQHHSQGFSYCNSQPLTDPVPSTDIEKQWAVKALHHAETYWKLISAFDPRKLRLTKLDDELYDDFRANWPDMNVAELDENEFKTESSKAKWRDFIMKYEKKVQDYNFGTLLRLHAAHDYAEDNAFFVTRLQFYAIEIARNREGANDGIRNLQDA
ncbi:hypothetical protein HK104_005482 [Borealophlyctis nickersoniae]|nr:hypothetical protein HK104_005482 [Borealophlyctis nickersoniae]